MRQTLEIVMTVYDQARGVATFCIPNYDFQRALGRIVRLDILDWRHDIV